MEIWDARNLESSDHGSLRSCEFGILEIWDLGNQEIKEFDILGI